MARIERFAPAKVNLSLEVTGRRASGYHELQSLVVFAHDVGDYLSFSSSRDISLKLEGPFAPGLEVGGGNLVVRAAVALRDALDLSEGAEITLKKNLPLAAGIGGGSADAAATLRGLAMLWNLDASPSRLAEIGLGLGADVPMCLSGEAAWITGIGEEIEPLSGFPNLWALLVNPMVPLSTPLVFKAYSDAKGTDFTAEKSAPDCTECEDLLSWLGAAENDLELPACGISHVLRDLLADLRALPGCLLGRMSGSGATSFGLFVNEENARAAAEELAARHGDWWLRVTQLGNTPHHC